MANSVDQAYMLGIICLMLAFFISAAIGVSKAKKRGKTMEAVQEARNGTSPVENPEE